MIGVVKKAEGVIPAHLCEQINAAHLLHELDVVTSGTMNSDAVAMLVDKLSPFPEVDEAARAAVSAADTEPPVFVYQLATLIPNAPAWQL